MRSSLPVLGRSLVSLIVVLGLGLGSRPLLNRVAEAPVQTSPALVPLGPSLSFAVLGGLRQVVANYFWLSAYGDWEARDMEEVRRQLVLAVSVDPEEWFFWSNGARMMAYDFPRWALDSQHPQSPLAEAELRERYGAEAIEWLGLAAAAFPEDYRVPLEEGMIRLHVLRDPRSAASAFKAAWEKPDAPLYTARIYGELMRQVGDFQTAYEWYCSWLEALSKEVRVSQVAIVLPRIRSLEEVLGISPDQSFELR